MEKMHTAELKPATSYTRFDADGKPYLEGSKCEVCETMFVGPRTDCGRCGARGQTRPVRFSDRGRLYTYTIVYRSYPGITVPFISAIVDLEGGGTVKGNLLEVPPDPRHVQFDMPLRMVFREANIASAEGAGHVAHFFVPAGVDSHG